MNFRSSVVSRVALVAAVAVAVGACSSSKNSSASSNSPTAGAGAASTAPVDHLAEAIAATAVAEKGTNRDVEATPRPAVKGKHVVIISAGQAVSSNSVPVNGAEAAAKAIGWQVEIYDAKINPGNYAGLVRQAIAAKADAIILEAIDCSTVTAPLQEAKAQNIIITGINAFDCNDPHLGGGKALFDGITNYGPKAADIDAFAESYAVDQANYIIAKSENKAKIITIQDNEFTVLYWTLQGFKKTIEASKGSQIVDELDITTSDLAGGKLQAKIQAELLKHPEATWIKSPFTFATTLGVVPALGSKAGQIKVMGGEGFKDELDLIRQGKITAVNIISNEWAGWGAVDTVNSLFLKQKPADSGIGWTTADKDVNLPASGEFVPPIDFKSEYKKAWGV